MKGLTRYSLNRPAVAITLLAIVTIGLAAGLPRVRTEFGSRVLIGNDHPAIVQLDAFIERYGGGVPLYIAWECGDGFPCESVFDPAALEMAHDVTLALRAHPAVRKILSPSNAPVFITTESGFAIHRLVEDDAISAEREALAKLALEDPTWIGNLVSSDGRVGAIIVQPVSSDSATDESIVAAILAALEPHARFDFKLVGEAFGNIIGGQELAESTATLVPVMVLVIALVIFLQTFSWQSVLSTLLTLGLALLWTFGVLGWLDWPRDSILELLAPLILIIGVCDSIHLLSVAATESKTAAGRDERRMALIRASESVWAPCAITTITTCAAFVSFATSDLDTFERFGVISAFGVAACLVLTFSFLPLLALALPQSGQAASRSTEGWNNVLLAVIAGAERRAWPILVGTTIALVVSAMGWSAYLRVDTSREELFGERSRILQWVRFFEDHLRPSYTLEIDLTLSDESPIEAPESLEAITKFSRAIETHEHAGNARSVVDLLTRLNRMLHSDQLEYERPSETLEGNAELLEIISFEDPDLLQAWLSFDRSRVRISVDAPEQNYAAGTSLLDWVEAEAAQHLPSDWKVETSGSLPLGVDWVRDVQATQFRSFPAAFALVLLVVSVSFRSLPLGLVATVPSVIPVVVVLGAMGFAGLSLDVGRAMIAAVVIGIAVDDGIHLLHRYRYETMRGNEGSEAMRQAFLHTGRPITTTSVALALGFVTLTASAWGTVSSFGFFVSLSILCALAATLFVLPALMVVFRRESGARDHS